MALGSLAMESNDARIARSGQLSRGSFSGSSQRIFRAIHENPVYRKACLQLRTIFITGTDTGVGKTVLTSLLLCHLRQSGHPAFALKPFCSGGRADAQLLHDLQNSDLTLDQVNPFYFREPLAPLVAARLNHRKISLEQTLKHIHQICTFLLKPHCPKTAHPNNPRIQQSTNPMLLIEGAGGLLSPLGEGFTAADIIKRLHCEVFVATANRLGAINHCLLTKNQLQAVGAKVITFVLFDLAPGLSRPRTTNHGPRTNPKILAELIHPTPLFHLPHLPKITKSSGKTDLKPLLITCGKELKKTLAQILQ